MTDRVQIGPEIDRRVWQRFRNHVEDKHGKTRGCLGDELENAIRHYINFGTDKPLTEQLDEFNQRLQRIEGEIGTAEADGGYTHSDAGHTHTRSQTVVVPDSKPAANSATEKKVAYLADELLEREVPQTREFDSIPRDKIRDLVKDVYGFRKDTAKRYVEAVVEHFELTEHPTVDGILVTETKRAEIIQDMTDDRMEDLDQ